MHKLWYMRRPVSVFQSFSKLTVHKCSSIALRMEIIFSLYRWLVRFSKAGIQIEANAWSRRLSVACASRLTQIVAEAEACFGFNLLREINTFIFLWACLKRFYASANHNGSIFCLFFFCHLKRANQRLRLVLNEIAVSCRANLRVPAPAESNSSSILCEWTVYKLPNTFVQSPVPLLFSSKTVLRRQHPPQIFSSALSCCLQTLGSVPNISSTVYCCPHRIVWTTHTSCIAVVCLPCNIA